MTTITPLVEAVEQAWKSIQKEFADVPDAVVLIGSGGRSAKQLYGYFAPDRWDIEGKTVHEVLIVAEQLQRGATDIFTTVIHEACHGIAKARDIKDCSGRRHNKRFKYICEEVGLDPPEKPSSSLGWSAATLSESLKWQFETQINAIDAALKGFRIIPSDKEKQKTSWSAACQCDRKIRVSKKIYDPDLYKKLDIVCTICGGEFEVDD